MSKKFEVSGYVDKEEIVNSLDHSIMPGTFVVEINHPFPGYYAEAMKEYSKPRSVLLMSKKKNTWEKTLRTAAKVNKFLDFKLNASVAEMYVGNQTHQAVRIKGMNRFEDIKTVQQAFTEEGFRFIKKRGKYKDETVVIKVKKFYSLNQAGEGLYFDDKQQEMAYVEIPSRLNWELFRKITAKIKNNINDNNYDAALATFYMNDGIQDIVRIFKPNNNAALLGEIRTAYLNEIARYE